MSNKKITNDHRYGQQNAGPPEPEPLSTPEAIAALPPCTFCHDAASDHLFIPQLGILIGCRRCACPGWGYDGPIDDDDGDL